LTLGGIVSEIDKKHSNYTKLSIDTIRYHLSADQTICGKLAALLHDFAASPADRQTRLLSLMEQNVRINRQEFADGRSIWRRNLKYKRLPLEPLAIEKDAGLSESDTDRLIKFLRNDYSLRHISRYIRAHLGENDFIRTRDFEIQGDREFLLLMLAAIRAKEAGAGFKIEIGEGHININGYNIPHMLFSKTGAGNVE
jgi:hypothetical protein